MFVSFLFVPLLSGSGLLPHSHTNLNDRIDEARTCTASYVLNDRLLHDFELLANGGFHPLQAWMTEAEYHSVLADATLPSGAFFPLPITLDGPKFLANTDRLCLTDAFNNVLAYMTDLASYPRDFEKESEICDPERDPSHPAIEYLVRTQDHVLLTGNLFVVQLPPTRKFLDARLTPAEVKRKLQQRQSTSDGRVVAFQTRNPLHLAHLTLAITAANDLNATLLLHPVVGPTKDDDVPVDERVRSYYSVLNVIHKIKESETVPQTLPPEILNIDVELVFLPLAMRLGGPREAGLHALVRRNYGATHFIVGRDHAGCKRRDGRDFYGPLDARDWLTAMATKHDLGIEIVGYPEFVFSEKIGRYVRIDTVPEGDSTRSLSGTKVRALLSKGEKVPDWFSLPEVVEAIRPAYRPAKDRGLVVFLVGLSGSGKSTLATNLVQELGERPDVLLLDGDVVRNFLGSGLGFSKDDRFKQLERVSWVAEEVSKRGGTVIVSMIAPYKQAREDFRRKIVFGARANFVEILVNTDLAVCEARDPKGLYRKARAGEIRLTGVNDPWEKPENPDLAVDGAEIVGENSRLILAHLKTQGIIEKSLSEISVIAPYVTQEEGEFGTPEFKMFFARPKNFQRISPWHDIPLYARSAIVNMVVEIPRGTRAKMEISTDQNLNPLMHDLTKTGDVRYYQHPKPLPGNYGLLPQTLGADGDPLDVLEISGRNFRSGAVVRFQVLGVMGLIDQGEEDWKIIVRAIDRVDGEAALESWSGELKAKVERWFREYKVYEGKKENTVVDMEMDAFGAIDEAHQRWKTSRGAGCTRDAEEL